MNFSIITATFNSSNVVADCLSSVTEQNYKAFEHLIIDGASTDNTLEIVAAQRGVDRRVWSEVDDGIYDALNKGIKRAQNDIVGFLHSDDVLASPDVLAKIHELFIRGGVDGVYGDLEYVNRSNLGKVIRYWQSEPFSVAKLKRGWMPPHPTLYLRREVYEKHGLFDTRFRISADYDFILRVMADPALQFAYLPQVIVKMRVGGASNRSLGNIFRKSREDLKALRKSRVGGLATLTLKNVSKVSQFFRSSTRIPITDSCDSKD